MGDAAQGSFDGAQDHGHARIGFPGPLGIDRDGPVRALVGFCVGGIGVVGADFPVRGIAVHHGIHVPRRNAEKEIGFAQALKILGRMPVRLADDTHPKALGLQEPPHQSHAKARMVDVGVPRN